LKKKPKIKKVKKDFYIPDRLLDLKVITKLVQDYREENLDNFGISPKIIVCNGIFDILHVGHIRMLEEAKGYGGKESLLIVALNSDESAKRLKGESRPIIPLLERAELLLATRYVDYVTFYEEDTADNVIKALKPSILVKGRDYKPKDVKERLLVEKYNGRVMCFGDSKSHSTTDIISKIRKV